MTKVIIVCKTCEADSLDHVLPSLTEAHDLHITRGHNVVLELAEEVNDDTK
jgi:hypothetical protein